MDLTLKPQGSGYFYFPSSGIASVQNGIQYFSEKGLDPGGSALWQIYLHTQADQPVLMTSESVFKCTCQEGGNSHLTPPNSTRKAMRATC